KEAVDHSLDACEEARILPDIYVRIEEVEKEKYKVTVRDNGPGISKEQIPRIFGSLLYGSKFHRLRQSRGQQGLGISVAVLYSQLTAGSASEVVSSKGDGIMHKCTLKIDVKNNEAVILSEESYKGSEWRGVQVTFISEGIYREHKQGVMEYIKETAISNPYANITFDSPTGRVEFKRSVQKLPDEPKEIKPHLAGIEIGILARMMHETTARSIESFFVNEFTRIGHTTAKEICKMAGIEERISPKKISDEQLQALGKAVKEVKLTRPPTDVLSPLGKELVISGMQKELNPEFVDAISRAPTVYRGWPFLIECGVAYGGSITEPRIMRFANRVPLLYQAGDCAMTKSIQEIDWKRYGIEADKLPTEPIAIFVHIASVWVPFTSESKEAVANYPIIIKEIKLALQEASRKLGLYLSGLRRAEYQAERRSIFERYANETAKSLSELTGEPWEKIAESIKRTAGKSIVVVEELEQEDESPSSESAGADE
ncbi:MAG: DNA topoisomerase VI subunit B, partial [Candidatus Aenigmarchaeota archaeon]|nr:DNA topoisomerase VI subunit B [Candidatus Aenigmarchaeota archaeon]